jgi:hypothetical protein
MFFIPGIVISILTFPGVIIHELAHFLFCRIRKVPVFDVKFFQLKASVQGYVIHAHPEDFLSTFLISVGPLIINTLLCLIICIPAAIPFQAFGVQSIQVLFFLWLGISIGMHAFPSTQDANILWTEALKLVKKGNVLAILSMPLVVLIFIANIARFIWFDAIYGFAIGVLIPMAIVTML